MEAEAGLMAVLEVVEVDLMADLEVAVADLMVGVVDLTADSEETVADLGVVDEVGATVEASTWWRWRPPPTTAGPRSTTLRATAMKLMRTIWGSKRKPR